MNLFDCGMLDRGSYAVHSTRTYDDKGYLKCHARVARSGIQRYYGLELGLKGDKAFKLFNIYRPPEVVFADSALADYLNADITNDHPKENVGAENFSRLSKGTVISKGTRDPTAPEYVMCDLLIKDASTIKAVEAGKVEISAGYDADLDFKPGEAPDGTKYDAIVKSIKLNHVAIVGRGRAGGARIADNDPNGGKPMDVNIGAVTIALNDEALANAVKNEIASMTAKVKDAESKVAVLDKASAEKDAKIADLQKQLKDAKEKIPSDAQIHQLFKDAMELREKAKTIGGEKFVCDSLLSDEIMREAIKASGVTIDLADKSEDYVKAYFDCMVADADKSAAKSSKTKVADAVANKVNDAGMGEDKEKDEDAAEANRKKIGDAWKTGLNLKK